MTKKTASLKNSVYPLVFTIRDLVAGKGWLAGVEVLRGRVLMAFEDDLWWSYGAHPGGLAESGRTPQESYRNFASAWRGVLADMASESKTYRNFYDKLQSFFDQVDDEDLERWTRARRAIREDAVQPEAPFSDLRRETSKAGVRLKVTRISSPAAARPENNYNETFATAA